MKDRPTFVRASLLIVALVVGLLLLVGIHTAMASTAPPVERAPDFPAAPNSAGEWSSGWVTIPIPAGAPIHVCQTFSHNLGRSPEEYAVELWFRDDGSWGRNRRYYGGVEDNGQWYGAWWQNLATNTIEVCRGRDDDAADEILVRVFEPLRAPDDASDWMNIPTHEPITYSHNLGITATDLTVGLWFSSTERGIHHFGYGGLADDPAPPTPGRLRGAHWYDLTTNTIKVRRHPQDIDVQQVRVVVVHVDPPPPYDSLRDLGDWADIEYGTNVFTHGLNWNPDLLMVRGECYTSTAGIHQWLVGGSVKRWGTPPGVGLKGVNIQNLTTNTVEVFRWQDDDVCPQARVRVWKRWRQIYLPLVVRDY